MEFPSFNNDRYESDKDDEQHLPGERKPAPLPPLPASFEYEPHGDREQARKDQAGVIYLRPPKPPIMEFLRKQSMDAKNESPEDETPTDEAPSVSTPGDPEVRTLDPRLENATEFDRTLATEHPYVPPPTNETEDETEDDDDDDTADETVGPSQAAQQPAAPEPQPVVNQRFEEMMQQNMGQTFAESTSGDQLGDEAETEEADVDADEIPTGPQTWHLPVESYQPPANETTPDTEAPGNDAFYYSEDEPDDPNQPAPSAQSTQSAQPGQSRPPTPPIPSVRATTRAYASIPPIGGGFGTGGPGGPGGGSGGGGGFGGGGTGGGMGGWYPTALGGAPGTPNALNPLAIQNAELTAEQRGLRRGLVAGFITGWLLKGYLAKRKLQRLQKATKEQLKQQGESLDRLQTEQQTTQSKLAASQEQLRQMQREQAFAPPPNAEQPVGAETPQEQAPTAPQQYGAPTAPSAEAPTPPTPVPAETSAGYAEYPQTQPSTAEGRPAQPVVTAEQTPAAAAGVAAPTPAELGQAYQLRPGEHIERTAGGHNVVVDRYGREVQGAMVYGEEFQSQQRREQASPAAFARNGGGGGSGASGGGAMADYSSIVTGLGGRPGQPGLPPSQTDWNRELPPSPQRADVQHLLPKGSSIMTTLSSPWLWAALIVLLVAFFVAAFI